MNPGPSKVSIRTLQKMKQQGERIAMLTAYDYSLARILDDAGTDVLLVGDSLGMVVQGKSSTVPVTVEEMIYHGEMVARAAKRAMVVVDLPFPVGQLGVKHTLKIAARIMKKTGCEAVKLEGGAAQADVIAALVSAGIPTIAHVGLRPQTVHALGGYRVHRNEDQLKHDAWAAESAGAFALLMECVPAESATKISKEIKIPTIGIGAGNGCDGQVLVTHDLLGMSQGNGAKFVRQYLDFKQLCTQAVQSFRNDVRSGQFPGENESYHS